MTMRSENAARYTFDTPREILSSLILTGAETFAANFVRLELMRSANNVFNDRVVQLPVVQRSSNIFLCNEKLLHHTINSCKITSVFCEAARACFSLCEIQCPVVNGVMGSTRYRNIDLDTQTSRFRRPIATIDYVTVGESFVAR